MLLSVKNIYKSFSSGENLKKTVLENISFDADAGNLVWLKGASGSGKSTLLNILSGLMIPDQGSVTVENEIINVLSESKRDKFRSEKIGFIFQTFNLISPLTALENVLMPRILTDGKQSDDKSKAVDILDKLGLAEHKNKFPYQLSVGQRQRVAVARVLLSEPKIILADEPTASLDNNSALLVKNAILSLKEKGTLVILAAHDNVFSDISADSVINLGGR